MTLTFNKPSVLIVGAGELGTTAGVEILRSDNYSAVTIIDRAPVLPALDAASTDINKVVRLDYTDPDYAKLAREAVDRWHQPKWNRIYHPTGMVVRGLTHHNAMITYQNAKALEPRVQLLETPEQIRAKLSPSGKAVVGKAALQTKAYFNPLGGWVHASGAINKLYDKVKVLGGQLVPGCDLQSLILTENGDDVRGVRCADGREFYADKVIIALGSWTGGHPALRGVFTPGLLVPTGQTVAAVQLTPEEYERYKDLPTIANLDGSGYYSFPPNSDGIVKFALHSGGYTVPNSIPRTAADKDVVEYTEKHDLGWIPKQSFTVMRSKFEELYPELAKSEFCTHIMC